MGYNGPYDFCGYATKNNLKCIDRRIIRKNAFKVNDGQKVPLVFNHEHNDPSMILGHAILENRDDGVYCYGVFNDGQKGQDAKRAMIHGDITNMSIWANELDQVGDDVLHGNIREVSLVLAGANPGAFVESVVSHGCPVDEYDLEGIFYTDEPIIVHSADEEKKEEPVKNEKQEEPKKEKKDMDGEKTVKEVYDTFNEEQKAVLAIIAAEIAKDSKNKSNKDEEDDEEMMHNVFDQDYEENNVLSHSAMEKIFADAKRGGSLRDAVRDNLDEGQVLAHSIDTTGMTTATGNKIYGFNDPDMLFPDYKSLNNQPEWLSRNMDWVSKVMGRVHHTPFSRIKSVYANITEDEARARGYIKGRQKKTEVFTTLKRTTDPQTIYKLQKLDRDDVIDITDFDVVAWIKAEMRVMLNEEIARAILIGDGRPSDSEFKISEEHIRPIVTDVPLYNTKVMVKVALGSNEQEKAKATINAIIRARKNYKGSGNPDFYTTEDVVTEMLLIEDGIGHKLYKSVAELATAIRAREIVTVEAMEGYQIDNKPLVGVYVNLQDYNVGADKGGAVDMFDDFDIDFNQMKYLIETRISGALIKPFAALTVLMDESGAPSETYTLLDEEPNDWDDNWTNYYEKIGSAYVKLTGDSAPTFQTNKYYEKD